MAEKLTFTRDFPEGCGNLSNNPRIMGFCNVFRDFPPGCGPNAPKIAPFSVPGSGFNPLKRPTNNAVFRDSSGGKIRKQGPTNNALIRKVGPYHLSALKGPGIMSGKVRQYEPSALKKPSLNETMSGKVQQYDPSASKKPALNESREREKVLSMLELFRKRCDELLRNGGTKRVDIVANRQLSQEGKIMKQPSLMFGSIPGVEVGDKFYYRIELTIVGLHRLFQGGIDSMEYGGERFATCIVACEGHLDKMGDPNVLCYIGEGGNLKRFEVGVPPDQVLIAGNLALNNSRKSRRPVRVVRGLRYGAGNAKVVYVYDGLYQVSETVKKKGPQGNCVFEFRMTRDEGQPAVPWKDFKRLFH